MGSADAAECTEDDTLSTCLDADNLWVRPGAGPFLTVGPTDTLAPGQASFGLLASYLSRPVVLTVASANPEGTEVYAIDNAVDATFLLAVGITERFELGAAVPVALYQDGGGIGDVLGAEDELPRSAIRHVRFSAEYALLAHPRGGVRDGLALVPRLELAVPTGDPRAFVRARGVTFVPSLAAEYLRGKLRVGAEVSARLRGESELAGAVIGSQLGLSAGASYAVLDRELLRLGAEGFALYTLADQAPPLADRTDFESGPALVPAEWMLTATTAPFYGGDLGFVLGGGGPIPVAESAALTAPRFRFELGVRFAPLALDADADGVSDRDDLCPASLEDRDGFEDSDGCVDPDNDQDRVPDEVDRCRDAAETVDGFEDADGCPDPDDDKDGLADEDDRCRNAAEDVDGFEDGDGCPELDNDGDGMPDTADQCPNGAEDKDGFKDQDGCPDLDNDLDQVPDTADACPLAAEDKDGFEDGDGCPEADNDRDGVADAADRCPDASETLDGKDDADGCPEPGARSLVSWKDDYVSSEKPLRFPAGKASLGKDGEATVRQMAALVRAQMPLEAIIIEAYADRPNDASDAAQLLAGNRADAIRAILVSEGLPAERITAAAGDPGIKRPAGAASVDVHVVRPRGAKVK